MYEISERKRRRRQNFTFPRLFSKKNCKKICYNCRFVTTVDFPETCQKECVVCSCVEWKTAKKVTIWSHLLCKWRTHPVVLDAASLNPVLIRRPKLTNGSAKFVRLTAYFTKNKTTDLGLFSDFDSKIFLHRGFLYLQFASKLLKVVGFLHDIPSLRSCIIIPFAYYLIFHTF